MTNTQVFDTSTLKGLRAAERCQARMYEEFESVTVYAIGLDRVRIVGRKPIIRGTASLRPSKV